VRFFGTLLAIASGAIAAYWAAFNRPVIGDFVGKLGGIGPLLGALFCALVVVIVAFWLPKKMHTAVKGVIRLASLIAAAVFGGPVVGAIVAQDSWMALLGLIVVVLGIALWNWIVFSMILFGRPFAVHPRS
jgi:Gpi18-like mannosyltransferase